MAPNGMYWRRGHWVRYPTRTKKTTKGVNGWGLLAIAALVLYLWPGGPFDGDSREDTAPKVPASSSEER